MRRASALSGAFFATLREPWHSPNRALARLIRPRIYDPRGGTVPAILLEILLFHKISRV